MQIWGLLRAESLQKRIGEATNQLEIPVWLLTWKCLQSIQTDIMQRKARGVDRIAESKKCIAACGRVIDHDNASHVKSPSSNSLSYASNCMWNPLLVALARLQSACIDCHVRNKSYILLHRLSKVSRSNGFTSTKIPNMLQASRRLWRYLVPKAGYPRYLLAGTIDRIARSQGNIPPEFHLDNLAGADVFDITVLELGAAYRKGEFTALEYTRFLIARIQSVRGQIFILEGNRADGNR